MSVSDESAASLPQPKLKPNWTIIQHEYETSRISQRNLAVKHGVSASTLMQRAMRDKWSQRGKLVAKAAAALEAEIDAKTIEIVRDELAPFIEKEKTKITKRGIRIGNRGLSRIEKLWRSNNPTEAKAEADTARAAEMLLRMARTSLGMTDGNAAGGSLSLRILTGQAAVQLVQNPA